MGLTCWVLGHKINENHKCNRCGFHSIAGQYASLLKRDLEINGLSDETCFGCCERLSNKQVDEQRDKSLKFCGKCIGLRGDMV